MQSAQGHLRRVAGDSRENTEGYVRGSFPGEKPKLIYYFSGLTFHQRPGPPSPDRTLSTTDSSSVKVTFKNLYGGLYGGIAWEW